MTVLKSALMMAAIAAMGTSLSYDDRPRVPEPESREHREYRKERREKKKAERKARKKNRK